MYGVLHNQYYFDAQEEADQREFAFYLKKDMERQDYYKAFLNKTSICRREANLQRIKKFNDTKEQKPLHLGRIPAFYPQNKLNELKHFNEEMSEAKNSTYRSN